MQITYGQAEAASMIVRAMASGRLLSYQDGIGVIDQGVDSLAVTASIVDGTVHEHHVSDKSPLPADPYQAAALAHLWGVAPECKATKTTVDMGVARREVVDALVEGRVLVLKGDKVVARSTDASGVELLVIADGTTGEVTYTRLDRSRTAQAYADETPLKPADPDQAAQLSAQWKLASRNVRLKLAPPAGDVSISA